MSKIVDLNTINKSDIITWYRGTYGVLDDEAVKVSRVDDDEVELTFYGDRERELRRSYSYGDIPLIDFAYPKIGFINVYNYSVKNKRVIEVKRRHKPVDSGSSLRYRKGFIPDSVELNEIVHRMANVNPLRSAEEVIYDIFFHEYPSFEEAFQEVRKGIAGLAVSSTLAIVANYTSNTYFLIRNSILLASWSHRKKKWITLTDKYNHELESFGLDFELKEV